ncbi:MAG: hypothetical protein LW865_01940 [Betaproteobacteria bacterium]|nr:hypothetical protein [Rhodocyclaceae bacterium]MCE2722036.1 hypothetical protein [Betaproteobacteria bacterium]
MTQSKNSTIDDSPRWAKGLAAAHAALSDPAVRSARCSTSAAVEANMSLAAKRRKDYALAPAVCANAACQKTLSYDQYMRSSTASFCSKSCATSVTNKLRLVSLNGIIQRTAQSARLAVVRACIEAEIMSTALLSTHPIIQPLDRCPLMLRSRHANDIAESLRAELMTVLREVSDGDSEKWFAAGGNAFMFNRITHDPAGDSVIATSLNQLLWVSIPLAHVLEVGRTHKFASRQAACTLAARQRTWATSGDAPAHYPSPMDPAMQMAVASIEQDVLAAAPRRSKVWLNVLSVMSKPPAFDVIEKSYVTAMKERATVRAAAWVCLFHMVSRQGALTDEIFSHAIYADEFPADIRAHWEKAQLTLEALAPVVLPLFGSREFRSQYGLVAALPTLR